MISLLPIILFVITDTYEKKKNTTTKMYSNVDKTDMIPIYGEFDKNVSAVARSCR
jgi:hypothetical protein